MTSSHLSEAALHYRSQGLRIFPLLPGKRIPFRKGSQGYKLYKLAKTRSLTEAEVRSFWAAVPDANIGLWTGAKSDLSAIDIDVDEFGNGNARLAELGAEHGFNVLDGSALVVLSPSSQSGGRHLYWRWTDNLPKNFNRKSYGLDDPRHGYGFDIRNSTDGYIVLPPSYSNGGDGKTPGAYRFENGMAPTEFGPAILKAFPYKGPWFNNLIAKKKHLKGHKSASAEPLWKPKRQIKEAATLYEEVDAAIAKYSRYRANDNIRKTIRKKDIESAIKKGVDFLKSLRILTLKNGWVLAKPRHQILFYYLLDFTDYVLASEMDDAVNVLVPRGANHHFHTFDDGTVRVRWTSHRKGWSEPRWILVNMQGKSFIWDDIHRDYL